MKRFITLFSLALCLVFSNLAHAITFTEGVDNTTTSIVSEQKSTNITVDDIKNLSIKEIEAKSGTKLTWKQKLGLKMAKNKIGKADGDGSTGIGFLLGFLLGLIGVLIAYLAFKDEPKTIKGAWIGFGVLVGLILILTIATLAAV
jgi:hypothetical protein